MNKKDYLTLHLDTN